MQCTSIWCREPSASGFSWPSEDEFEGGACCEDGQWDLTLAGENDLDVIEGEIWGSCAPFDTNPEVRCIQETTLYAGETCWTQDKEGIEADYQMTIDPAHSYVDVDLGAETVYSSLDGWALADTNPKRFIRAFAEAEDFTYDGDNYTSNVLFLLADIELSGTGTTCTVPLNQDCELYFAGLVDGDDYAYSFEPQVTSGGTFDVSAGSWSYDYTQTGSGTAVEVHLEGALTGVSAL